MRSCVAQADFLGAWGQGEAHAIETWPCIARIDGGGCYVSVQRRRRIPVNCVAAIKH